MWFYAALGVAFIAGITTIISKQSLKTISPIVFFWSVLVVSTPLVFLVLIDEGFPSFTPTFFVGVFGSIFFYTISKLIYYQTIKDAELSYVYPLVAFGPIFTLGFSALILSENPTLGDVFGIVITILGVYVLNISSAKEGVLEPFRILARNKLSLLMLLSVFIGSVVGVLDKFAILQTTPQTPNFTLVVENLFLIFGILPWIVFKRKTTFPEIKMNFKWILSFGILQAVSNMLGFFALSEANPGIASSVFRTQIFFVLLFSYFFFGDRPKTETIIGTIIMIFGLVVLKLVN